MANEIRSIRSHSHTASSQDQNVFDKRQFSVELKRLNFPELEKILWTRGFTETDFIELNWAKSSFGRYTYHLYRISIEKLDRDLFDAISLVYVPPKGDMDFLEIFVSEHFCKILEKEKANETLIYLLFNVLGMSSQCSHFLAMPLKASAEIGALDLVEKILHRFPKTNRSDALEAAQEKYDGIVNKETPESMNYRKILMALSPQGVDADWLLV